MVSSEIPKSLPQGLKLPFFCIAYTGDKSPAYRPNDFFSKLRSRALSKPGFMQTSSSVLNLKFLA
jgi:hypothetical protein